MIILLKILTSTGEHTYKTFDRYSIDNNKIVYVETSKESVYRIFDAISLELIGYDISNGMVNKIVIESKRLANNREEAIKRAEKLVEEMKRRQDAI